MEEFCSLYVFSGVAFERHKNPIIEDISGLYGINPNFLNNLTIAYSNNKRQLPKMTLTQELVIPAEQGLVYSKNTPSRMTPRYVMYVVKLSDTGTNRYRYYYYYVDNVEWNAMSSVRLRLTMDTLNTYKELFVFSNRTHITRKHADRMWCNPTPYTSGGHTYYKMTRIVDRMSEGFNLPLEHYSQRFVHETGDSASYSVLYKSNSLDNSFGVKFYVINSDGGTYTNSVNSIVLDKTELFSMANDFGLDVGDIFYLYFTDYDNGLNADYIYTVGGTDTTFTSDGTKYVLIKFIKGTTDSDSNFAMFTIRWDKYTERLGSSNLSPALTKITLKDTLFCRVQTSKGMELPQVIHSENFKFTKEEIQNIPFTYTLLSRPGNYTIKKYSNINRLDPLNIKLINIPYKPNTSLIETYDVKNQLVEIDAKELINAGMTRAITSTNESPLQPYWFYLQDPTTSGMKTKLHDISNDYESKMYHSDFYYTKLSYDTSSIIVHLERFDYHDIRLNWSLSAVLSFDFTLSLNLNSNMTFVFSDLEEAFADNDFNYVLASTRNNETILFNNAYLDYLKTGYNYDKQNKDLQTRQAVTSNIVGGVMSIVGSVIGSVAMQNPAPMVAGIIGAVTSAVHTGVQINQINEQYNNALAQKQAQLTLQGQSVSGISDYDLFRTYSEDKVRIDKYRVIEPLKAMVENYFYLYGYKCDIYDSPDHHNASRLWRNFIQADVDFDSELVGGIDVDIASDIVNKFKEGVTYFHNVDDNYDFKQEMENWEMNVYNTVLANE